MEQELDEEMRYHLDRLIDDYAAGGMALPEARYRALQEMGAIETRKEECRDARGLAVVDGLLVHAPDADALGGGGGTVGSGRGGHMPRSVRAKWSCVQGH